MRLDKDFTFSDDDLVIFTDDKKNVNHDNSSAEHDTAIALKDEHWKILIIDDEKDIHNVTKMVLKDIHFEGKSVRFFSAYSGLEGRNKISEIEDIAVILLDVVMEEDDSGLNLVKYIRDVLKNNLVRIILRTGYPGEAPEREVILNYDINDYKDKTELTSQKLFTSVISALRAYKDIVTIESNKRGLEKIIDSSAAIFELKHLNKFTREILDDFKNLIGKNEYDIFDGFVASNDEDEYKIISGKGKYENFIDINIREVISDEAVNDILEVIEKGHNVILDRKYIGYFRSKEGQASIVCLEYKNRLADMEMSLIEVFDKNVTIAFDNVYLNKEIENTQAELLFTLGEVVEVRSEETGNHVRRVSEYARMLAIKSGMPEDEADGLKMASPMHDLGKIGIPDNILNKQGALTLEEFEVIKRHPVIGYELLKKSKRDIFRVAAIVALEHHEHYDGNGYPRGIKGEEIHLYGRIMAICDVFDALSSDRIYRKAWEIDRIIDYMEERRGTQFDPKLLTLFIENIDEVKVVMESLRD